MKLFRFELLTTSLALSAMMPSTGLALETSSTLGYWITTEAAAAWQSHNDIEIPKDEGTRFSFRDFGDGPVPAGRIYAGFSFNKIHELRALYAPLSLNLSGKLSGKTKFAGETFLPGKETDALYRFNSYRLTYRYRILDDESFNLKVGFTGKIRDAEIRLEQGEKTASRKNVGFVPLLHLAGEYTLSPELRLIADADALAAPQGRAEDVALLLAYNALPTIQVYGGYRTVEGGADGGGKVYNFTWLNFAVAGVTWAP